MGYVAKNIYSLPVILRLDNEFHEFDAVYLVRRHGVVNFEDTKPEGSAIGTVIAMHGAPGSHRDFKYITPILRSYGIRVIGINFPGFGLSSGLWSLAVAFLEHASLKHDHVERGVFIQSIVDQLNLNERLVFMGHSRGSENALKAAAMNIVRGLLREVFKGANRRSRLDQRHGPNNASRHEAILETLAARRSLYEGRPSTIACSSVSQLL